MAVLRAQGGFSRSADGHLWSLDRFCGGTHKGQKFFIFTQNGNLEKIFLFPLLFCSQMELLFTPEQREDYLRRSRVDTIEPVADLISEPTQSINSILCKRLHPLRQVRPDLSVNWCL